jgi:protease IV
MKKFLLGIFVGLVFSILALVVVAFSFIRLGDSKPRVPEGATLVLRLSDGVPEKPAVSLPFPFQTTEPLTVAEIWSGLRRAATDARVKALILEIGHVDAGWAKAQEIRENLQNFRKSGKPVFAYMKAPRMREYYIASAADRMYVMPEDLVDVKGLRAELLYFKNTLDKLGVKANVQHVGQYKDAGDMLTQTSMSPSTRESLGLMLDGIYNTVLQTIATSRRKSVDEIRAIVDEGPFTAREAHSKGLVDALRYQDQVYGEMKDRLKSGELKRLTFRNYLRGLTPESGAGKRVALIVGEGTIVRGAGSDAMGTDEGFSSGAFIRLLRQVREDKNISGVIVRVDSPGGDAFASDEILREVKLLRDKKPVVYSMSDAAASGGYYVTMTGDPIVAYPNTVTGSIGVLFTSLDVKGLYDKLGINREVLTRGRNADIDSGYGPLPEEGRAKVQRGLEEFYRSFVTQVAQSRRRKYEQVEPLAQGRVWLGMHARERGLVDELGGIDTAIAALRKKAGMKPDERIRIAVYPPKRTWLEQLMRSSSDAPGVEAQVAKALGFDPRVLLQKGYLRLLPFQLEIR